MNVIKSKKIDSGATGKLCAWILSNASSLAFIFLVAVIEVISTTHEAEAAGLACEGKTNLIERTICSHEKLRVADKVMNDIYQELRKTENLSSEEVMRQRKWLQSARDSCQDNDQCIFDAYSIRAEELAAITTQDLANSLSSKDRIQISGLVEGRMRTPNWLEGGRPTESLIFKSADDKLYTKSYFSFPANGKTLQIESDYFDIQTVHPFVVATNLKSNFQELRPIPECSAQLKLNVTLKEKWGCLAQTYKRVDRKSPLKSEIDDCPVRSDTLVLLRWTVDGLKRYRLVVSNKYPKVYENSLCTFLSDSYRVYSERSFYEPQAAQLYDLNKDEMGLLVDNFLLKINKNSEKTEYDGIQMVDEGQLERVKLEVWNRVDKTLEKRAQIIAYESLLDKALSQFFKKVNSE